MAAMGAPALARLRAAVARQLEHPSTLASATSLAEMLACDPRALPKDHAALATCLAKQGSYAAALAALERIPTSQLDEDARYLRAWCQFRLGSFREARDTLEASGQQEGVVPKGSVGLHLLGQICEAGGYPSEAERYYSQALDQDPYFFDARERLAVLRASERTDLAAVRPDNGDDALKLLNMLERACGLLARYRCDEALVVLSGLPPAQANTGYVMHQTGRAYFEKADFAKACTAFTAMRQADPFRLRGLELFSTALWHCKRSVDLASLSHDVEAKHPRTPETFCVLGNSFSLEKEHDIALRFFRKACEVDSKFTYAFTLAGHEYVANEDFDKAMTCYRTALRIDPNHYNAWWGLGTIYFRQEKNDLAEKHFRNALNIHPTSSILWCFLGIVLHAQKRHIEALDALEQAGKLNPFNPQVRFQRAHVLVALNRLEDALIELEAVRDVAPREASVHLLMGNISKLVGMRDRAMYHFVSALDLEPKDAATVRAAIDQLDDTIADRSRMEDAVAGMLQ